MKLQTPFSILKQAFRDIDYIHDFTYELPYNKQKNFWEEECELHPTKSACKTYDV